MSSVQFPAWVQKKELFSESEEIALFQEFQSTQCEKRKKRIADKIVMNFTPLVYKIQRSLSGYKMKPEDLIGEGNLGLTEAVHRFKLENGNRFSAFAIAWIRGVMMAYITRNYSPVNCCTDTKRKSLFFKLRKHIAELQKEMGTFDLTNAMLQTISNKIDIPVKDIEIILNMFRSHHEGLDDTINEDGTSTKMDLIAAEEMPNHFEEQDQNGYRREIILEGMNTAKLTPRERRVIETQFLRDGSKLTLEELGNEFNVSKERVRQIRNKAHERLVEAIRQNAQEGRFEKQELFA